MDLVKLETARQIFSALASLMDATDAGVFVDSADVRGKTVDACADAADRLCSKVGEAKGHPAETALEQLFDLLKDAPDERIVKWVKANAKLRGMRELCVYLGAERE